MNEKKRVQDQFGKYAARYVTSTTHAKGEDLPLLLKWVEPKTSWRVLDMATGGGHVPHKLAPFVSHVTATDLTKAMLEAAATFLNQHSNIDFVVADAEQLPFLDETFDLVTCRIAAHHFPNPEKFVQEAARVLKKGGKFVLIDNISPEDANLATFYHLLEKRRDPSHQRALSITEWESLMKKHGLHVKKDSSRKKTLPFWDWVNRMVEEEGEIEVIRKMLQEAKQEHRDYFEVKEREGKLYSFAVDEWMVMCHKV